MKMTYLINYLDNEKNAFLNFWWICNIIKNEVKIMQKNVNGKNKMTFSSFYRLILRILSVVAIITLLYGAIRNFIYLKDTMGTLTRHIFFSSLFFAILNIITVVCFFILLFRPDKLAPLSMVSIFYGIPNLIDNGDVAIGYFMLILFCLSLFVQGFFKKRIAFKICLMLICFIALMFTNLRFGFHAFLDSFVYVIGYTLIFFVIILMFTKYQLEYNHSIIGQKLLDLRKPVAEGLLKARDVKWLKQILNGDKYSAIASESAVSDGTMRNRIREVFKVIGVTDRKQFLTIYDGAIVITTQQEFEEWKNTLV